LALLGPFLPEAVRAAMRQWSIDELLTKLVLLTRLSEVPPELVGTLGSTFTAIPGPVVDQVADLIGVEGAGVTPASFELRKGRPYAVVSWAAGHGAKLLTVDTTFNWVTLLNVFNGILPGLLVDGLTGAWFNLTPKDVIYTLDPLPSGPAAP
jgi:hypothetical protein